MKYRYNTVTGEHEIEVDEQVYSMLLAMDKEGYNSDHKFRRHNPVSLSNADYEGDWMEDETDILGDLIHAEDREHLHAVLAQLTRDQQTLIERVFFNQDRIVDIARGLGVSQPAVSQRLTTALKKLKECF